jgi:long-chain acyl-CoA synthetase
MAILMNFTIFKKNFIEVSTNKNMIGLIASLTLNIIDRILFLVLYYVFKHDQLLSTDQQQQHHLQLSVEISEEPEHIDETIPRRSILSPQQLVTTPHESVHTMNELFEYSAMNNSMKPCLGKRNVTRLHRVKRGEKPWLVPELESIQYQSYQVIRERIHRFASGLTQFTGLNSKGLFGIYEDTKMEWLMTLQACFRYNITVVTVYASLGDDALISAINETKITAMLISESNLNKFEHIAEACPSLKYLIYCQEFHEDVTADRRIANRIESLKMNRQISVLSFEEVEELGKLITSPPPIKEEATSDSLALIMYTSGTTSEPKGVMITHQNLLAVTEGVKVGVGNPSILSDIVYCAFLPLAHILEIAAEHFVLVNGGCIGYGTLRTLTAVGARPHGDLTDIRPTVIAGIPRVYDMIKKSALYKVQRTSPIIRFLFNTAYQARLKAVYSRRDTPLWNLLVFRKFRSLVGSRLMVILSGGAPLSKETHEFIRVCFGCPIIQGYGLTETSAGATIQSIFHPFQTSVVGPPIPCAEIKLRSVLDMGYSVDHIPPRGEILVRGPAVSKGYFKRDQLSEESFFDDGWFATGDIGQLNLKDGTFSIIDRKKNLVKLSHGEYIALERLESIYGNSRFVAPNGIMIYADPAKSDFIVAIVLAQRTTLKSWSQQNHIEYSDLQALCKNPQLIRAVRKDLKEQAKLAGLRQFEEVRDVRVFVDEWLPDNFLVTSAYKLKRSAIAKKYKKWIDEMYNAQLNQ